MFKGVIPYAHELLEQVVGEGDIVVDATCGNGNDTLFLAKTIGPSGHVYSFDVQEQAIDTAKELLLKNGQDNVSYILDSHANIEAYIPSSAIGTVSGAIFNLGYLPRSDKTIITEAESTLAAIEILLTYIKLGGRIVLVVYHGHVGGKEEKDAVLSYVAALDQKKYGVIQYGFVNQKNNPPFVIAIEKRAANK